MSSSPSHKARDGRGARRRLVKTSEIGRAQRPNELAMVRVGRECPVRWTLGNRLLSPDQPSYSSSRLWIADRITKGLVMQCYCCNRELTAARKVKLRLWVDYDL